MGTASLLCRIWHEILEWIQELQFLRYGELGYLVSELYQLISLKTSVPFVNLSQNLAKSSELRTARLPTTFVTDVSFTVKIISAFFNFVPTGRNVTPSSNLRQSIASETRICRSRSKKTWSFRSNVILHRILVPSTAGGVQCIRKGENKLGAPVFISSGEPNANLLDIDKSTGRSCAIGGIFVPSVQRKTVAFADCAS